MDKELYKKLAELLKNKIGAEKIITDSDIMEKYSRDETSGTSHMPDIVVRPESANDISEILKVCSKYKVPAVTRGAGTGVTGGAIPANGGVVVSLEKMNRIIEIDKENMIAVVEPCVINKDLQDKVAEYGLMYPPDPASLESCSIGGNVAEGAGGPKAVKYGTTKDYITGLEFVLPNGDIISIGGKIVKNATGYNLIGMLIGSEGTLAVITKIYVKLIPAPAYTTDLLLAFDTLEEAIETVPKIIINKIIPSTIEFIEKDAIMLVKGFLNEDLPHSEAGAHLLIQIDGHSRESVMRDLDRLSEVISTKYDILVAESAAQKERLWKIRRSIRLSIEDKNPVFLAEDCVVPRSKIADFIKEVKGYLNSMSLHSALFGHAGDGNVHIDVLKEDMNNNKWLELVPILKQNIYKMAISCGGTITGEHGIGLVRKDYIHLGLSKEAIELSKRIKAAFDPEGILNPGKVF